MQAWNSAGKIASGINVAQIVDSIENVELTGSGDMFFNNPAQDPEFLRRVTSMVNSKTAKTEAKVAGVIMNSQMAASQSGGDTFSQMASQQATRAQVQTIMKTAKAEMESAAQLMMKAAMSRELAARDRENADRLFNPASSMDEQTMSSIDEMSRTEVKGPKELDTGVSTLA